MSSEPTTPVHWDEGPVIALGNAWIDFGDKLWEQISAMDDAARALTVASDFHGTTSNWSGDAAFAFSDGWRAVRDQGDSVAESCWSLGEAINYYAILRTQLENTQAKEQLAQMLEGLFGIVLMFIPLFDIGEIIGVVAEWAARIGGVIEAVAGAVRSMASAVAKADSFVINGIRAGARSVGMSENWQTTMANLTWGTTKMVGGYTVYNMTFNSVANKAAGLPVGKDQLSPVPSNAGQDAQVGLLAAGFFSMFDHHFHVQVGPGKGSGAENVPVPQVPHIAVPKPDTVGGVGGTGDAHTVTITESGSGSGSSGKVFASKAIAGGGPATSKSISDGGIGKPTDVINQPPAIDTAGGTRPGPVNLNRTPTVTGSSSVTTDGGGRGIGVHTDAADGNHPSIPEVRQPGPTDLRVQEPPPRTVTAGDGNPSITHPSEQAGGSSVRTDPAGPGTGFRPGDTGAGAGAAGAGTGGGNHSVRTDTARPAAAQAGAGGDGGGRSAVAGAGGSGDGRTAAAGTGGGGDAHAAPGQDAARTGNATLGDSPGAPGGPSVRTGSTAEYGRAVGEARNGTNPPTRTSVTDPSPAGAPPVTRQDGAGGHEAGAAAGSTSTGTSSTMHGAGDDTHRSDTITSDSSKTSESGGDSAGSGAGGGRSAAGAGAETPPPSKTAEVEPAPDGPRGVVDPNTAQRGASQSSPTPPGHDDADRGGAQPVVKGSEAPERTPAPGNDDVAASSTQGVVDHDGVIVQTRRPQTQAGGIGGDPRDDAAAASTKRPEASDYGDFAARPSEQPSEQPPAPTAVSPHESRSGEGSDAVSVLSADSADAYSTFAPSSLHESDYDNWSDAASVLSAASDRDMAVGRDAAAGTGHSFTDTPSAGHHASDRTLQPDIVRSGNSKTAASNRASIDSGTSDGRSAAGAGADRGPAAAHEGGPHHPDPAPQPHPAGRPGEHRDAGTHPHDKGAAVPPRPKSNPLEQWRIYRDNRDDRAEALLNFAADQEGRRSEVIDAAFAEYLRRHAAGEYGDVQVIDKYGLGYVQAIRDFHRVTVRDFKTRWEEWRQTHGFDAVQFSREHARHVDQAHLHFDQAAQRAHELRQTQTAIDRALGYHQRFGRTLPEDADVPTDLAHYEGDGWSKAFYRTEGARPRPGEEGHVPASISELRADALIQTRRVVDQAFEAFPNDSVARSEAIARGTSALHDGLDERILTFSIATRRVDAAMERADAHWNVHGEFRAEVDGWDPAPSRGITSDETFARTRTVLRRDFYTFHQRIYNKALADTSSHRSMDERWDEVVTKTFDTLQDRIAHAEFRQMREPDFESAIQKAWERNEQDFMVATLGPDAQDRVTTELRLAHDQVIDEAFFSDPRVTDFRAHPLKRWDGDEKRPARDYREGRAALDATFDARIEHERGLGEALEHAASDFHRLRGPGAAEREPQSGWGADRDLVDEIKADYSGESVTVYNLLFAPHEHDMQAWLQHQDEHEDAFQTRLTELAAELPSRHMPERDAQSGTKVDADTRAGAGDETGAGAGSHPEAGQALEGAQRSGGPVAKQPAGRAADDGPAPLRQEQVQVVIRAGRIGSDQERVAAWQKFDSSDRDVAEHQRFADEYAGPDVPDWLKHYHGFVGVMTQLDRQGAQSRLSKLGIDPVRVRAELEALDSGTSLEHSGEQPLAAQEKEHGGTQVPDTQEQPVETQYWATSFADRATEQTADTALAQPVASVAASTSHAFQYTDLPYAYDGVRFVSGPYLDSQQRMALDGQWLDADGVADYIRRQPWWGDGAKPKVAFLSGGGSYERPTALHMWEFVETVARTLQTKVIFSRAFIVQSEQGIVSGRLGGFNSDGSLRTFNLVADTFEMYDEHGNHTVLDADFETAMGHVEVGAAKLSSAPLPGVVVVRNLVAPIEEIAPPFPPQQSALWNAPQHHPLLVNDPTRQVTRHGGISFGDEPTETFQESGLKNIWRITPHLPNSRAAGWTAIAHKAPWKELPYIVEHPEEVGVEAQQLADILGAEKGFTERPDAEIVLVRSHAAAGDPLYARNLANATGRTVWAFTGRIQLVRPAGGDLQLAVTSGRTASEFHGSWTQFPPDGSGVWKSNWLDPRTMLPTYGGGWIRLADIQHQTVVDRETRLPVGRTYFTVEQLAGPDELKVASFSSPRTYRELETSGAYKVYSEQEMPIRDDKSAYVTMAHSDGRTLEVPTADGPRWLKPRVAGEMVKRRRSFQESPRDRAVLALVCKSAPAGGDMADQVGRAFINPTAVAGVATAKLVGPLSMALALDGVTKPLTFTYVDPDAQGAPGKFIRSEPTGAPVEVALQDIDPSRQTWYERYMPSSQGAKFLAVLYAPQRDFFFHQGVPRDVAGLAGDVLRDEEFKAHPVPVVLLGGGNTFGVHYSARLAEHAWEMAEKIGQPVVVARAALVQGTDGRFRAGTAYFTEEGELKVDRVTGDDVFEAYYPDGRVKVLGEDLDVALGRVFDGADVSIEQPAQTPDDRLIWSVEPRIPLRKPVTPPKTTTSESRAVYDRHVKDFWRDAYSRAKIVSSDTRSQYDRIAGEASRDPGSARLTRMVQAAQEMSERAAAREREMGDKQNARSLSFASPMSSPSHASGPDSEFEPERGHASLNAEPAAAARPALGVLNLDAAPASHEPATATDTVTPRADESEQKAQTRVGGEPMAARDSMAGEMPYAPHTMDADAPMLGSAHGSVAESVAESVASGGLADTLPGAPFEYDLEAVADAFGIGARQLGEWASHEGPVLSGRLAEFGDALAAHVRGRIQAATVPDGTETSHEPTVTVHTADSGLILAGVRLTQHLANNIDGTRFEFKGVGGLLIAVCRQ